MLSNYLKIAFRTLLKNGPLSALNVIGLAVGMACSLLIFLFVQDELSYDKHNTDAKNIYRVVKDFINDDGSRIPDATTPAALAPAMQRELPEVVTIVRIFPTWGGNRVLKLGDQEFLENSYCTVDSSFFNVFTVPFIAGDPKTALIDANSVVLTASTAKRYFGSANPIGKTLQVIGSEDVTVTAVVKDPPKQSHFHYDFLFSFRQLPSSLDTNWGGYNYYTYVKVKNGTDIALFEKKTQDLYEHHEKDSHINAYYTQPLADIHLTSKLKWELEPNGDKMYVYIFSIIGIFILVIAGINYVNLSTARSALRAKETGIRKISGAERSSLVFQFVMESLILCSIASILAFTLAYAVAPMVGQITQKELNPLNGPTALLFLGATTLALGLVAGFFPALYLSSFRPVVVLKSFKMADGGALNLRKTLVVVQFTISIALIISTIIIARQMDHIRSVNLGFNKDQVLVIQNVGFLKRQTSEPLISSLKTLSGVSMAAGSGNSLGEGFSTTRLRAEGSQQSQQLNFTSAHPGFLELMGMQLIEGRSFSTEIPADTMSNGISKGPLNQSIGGIIINERAAKEFGLESPIAGKRLVWDTDGDTTYFVTVVGVIKDFHFTSLRNEIKPFGYIYRPGWRNAISVKISSSNIASVVGEIEKTWKSFAPDIPFSYTFLDDRFNRMYVAEARFQQLFIILVGIGVIIACLGLFALAAFSAEQRVKEIGIRKVLGASVGQLVRLLSWDFIKLVLIALVLAIPISIYAMKGWLQGFAYRVSMEWWIFGLAAVISIVIAVLTTTAQALKAAVSNPTKSLRSE